MNLDQFLSAIATIKALSPQYRLGHTGDDGYCDCIGLVIGAVERCGGQWSGVHGSNWWARHYTHSLMRVTAADDLLLGDLVYKARGPGASGYDLPGRYKDDPDRLDYYHVGVVTGVSPLEITHCTKGGDVDGIMVDTKLGKWTYRGQLTLLDGYADDGKDDGNMATKAMVYAENGKPVNLRRRPSTSTARLTTVPVGTVVDVYEVEDGWARVRANGEDGYMMAEFLQMEAAGGLEVVPGAAESVAEVLTQLVKDVQSLAERVDALEDRVSGLEGGVG